MQNYSQSTEQDIIFDYFGNYVGNFLDLGSNDGITLSNTYGLFKKGWSGTCVDASPKAFDKLINTHLVSRVQCLNLAVGSSDGEIEFYESGELLGKGDVALVSSTNPEELKRWESLNMPFEKIKVPIVSFKTLLEKCDYKTYEFLSLDVESMELEILPQIDFSELQTQLVCVEFNGKDLEKYQAIMEPQGFKIIHTNAENIIFTL